MNETLPYFGEILAFLSAISWAIGVVLFKKSGESLHPLALNLYKNTLALILFLITMVFFKATLFRPAPFSEYLLFIASGVIGIGIGDSLFFKSLNKIGAGLSAIVDCLYSPFVISLSIIWLGESLNRNQIVGVVLIVSAVLMTMNVKPGTHISRHELIWGIIWGIIAILAMSVAIVMIKPALEKAPLLWAIVLRLCGGMICIFGMLCFHPMRKKILKSLTATKGLRFTIPGALSGTYASILFWMGGMKFAHASIAAALNQTSNVFVFLFAALFLKEHLTWRHILALILGIAGALLTAIG